MELSECLLIQFYCTEQGEKNGIKKDGSPQNIYLDALIFLKLLHNLTKMERVKENLACLFFREHRTKHKHAHPYIIGFAGLISKYQ